MMQSTLQSESTSDSEGSGNSSAATPKPGGSDDVERIGSKKCPVSKIFIREKDLQGFIDKLSKNDRYSGKYEFLLSDKVNIFVINEDSFRHRCIVCSKSFHGEQQLRKHMKIHEAGKRACTVCGVRAKDLKAHMVRHSDERPYSCKICNKSFKVKGSLTTHERLHKGERSCLCHVCGASFFELYDLNKHVRVHTNERPFSCSLFSKAFKSKYHLQVHTRSHTGEKSYACTICDKAFTTSGNLHTHVNTHSAQKVYTCNFCGKSFSQKSYLKKHTDIHPADKPPKNFRHQL